MAQSSNTMSSAVSSSQSVDGLTAAMLAMVTMFDKKNDEVKDKAEELESADRLDKENAKFDRFINSLGRIMVDTNGKYSLKGSDLAAWLNQNLPNSESGDAIKWKINSGQYLTKEQWTTVNDLIIGSSTPQKIKDAWNALGAPDDKGVKVTNSDLVTYANQINGLSQDIKNKLNTGQRLSDEEWQTLMSTFEAERDKADGGTNSKIMAVELDVLVSELNFFLNMMKETVGKHNEGLQTVSKNW